MEETRVGAGSCRLLNAAIVSDSMRDRCSPCMVPPRAPSAYDGPEVGAVIQSFLGQVSNWWRTSSASPASDSTPRHTAVPQHPRGVGVEAGHVEL